MFNQFLSTFIFNFSETSDTKQRGAIQHENQF